ncbi:MAG: carbohydrate-binding protein [Bacteroidota bacterium]
MRSLRMALIVMSLGLGVYQSHAQLGIARVWAIDDGEKIQRNKINYPAANGTNNPVWSGSQISLFGARNEVVAFQLIVQGSLLGATGVNVRLDSLTKSSTPAYTIKNTGGFGDPYNYAGKKIEMFVEHYQNVTNRSSASFLWWGSARPLPDIDFTSYMPEQLVPFESPAGNRTHGQGGAPFSVPLLANQAVWVDIYIPRETPAGSYAGILRVTENSTVRYSLPVKLKVYDFMLSDTTHLHSMAHIDFPGIVGRHGVTKWSSQYWSLMKKYYAMGHRHRLDVTDGRLTLSNFTANLGSMYTGTYYTPANKYEGPGEGVGNLTYSIGTYDQPRSAGSPDRGSISGFTYDSDLAVFKATWQSASNQWVNWFEANAPATRIHKYMADEPGVTTDSSIFKDIRRKAGWLKTNPGSGRRLRTLATSNIRPDLRGSIDIWMGSGQSGYVYGAANPYPGGYVISAANAARARGELAGFYNGSAPSFGTQALDAPATHMRVNPWIAWKYKADMYYLWYVNHWGDEGGTPIDPWKGDKRNQIWGDGSFIYAGQNKNSTLGNDRGLAGPIAGIRMKNWRRGAQDYEYLYLARQMGINVSALVDSLVPEAFDQAPQNEQATFAQRGYRFEKFRRQLADLLEGTPNPAPSGVLTATPNSLPVGGGNVTLSWSSTNTTSASLDNGIGQVPTNGSLTVLVDTSTTFVLTLNNAQGTSTTSAFVAVGDTDPQTPFLGSPFAIPGTVQAEDFDNGGEEIAFSDTDPSNQGGVYRATGVDLQATTDVGGGYNIAWVRGDEWLEYTVDIAQSGAYIIDTRVASTSGGGTIHIEFNGVDKTGPIAIPATGGWQSWQTISKSGIELDSGRQVMRIVAENIGSVTSKGNINFVSIISDDPVPVTNLINNPSFESGTSGWTFHTDRTGTFSSDGPGVDGPNAAKIRITRQGENVQLYQSGVSLQSGVSYRLTFSAYSSTGHNLSVWMHKQGSPYTNYGLDEHVINLTTSWRSFSIQFTAGGFNGTVNDARLRFWLAPYDAAGDYYFFDNVVLVPISAPGGSAGSPEMESEENPDSPVEYSLNDNYPNPFNPSTTILYSIPEDARVSIGVYDILGRLVIQLTDDHQPMGTYRVTWNGTNDGGQAVASGIYFYKMDARGSSGKTYSNLKKMVLTK